MPIREYNVLQPHWRGGVLVESGTVQVDENAAKYDVTNGNLGLVEERTGATEEGNAPEPAKVATSDVAVTQSPQTPQDAIAAQGDSARGSVTDLANPATEDQAADVPTGRNRKA